MEDRASFGSCLCGSVRYEIAASLENAEYCHCSMCRKAHGAAFSANSIVPTEALTVSSGADLISEFEFVAQTPKVLLLQLRVTAVYPAPRQAGGNGRHPRYS